MVVRIEANFIERFELSPGGPQRSKRHVLRFTVGDVERLLRTGVVPEDASTELLNGEVVLKDRASLGKEPQVIGLAHTLVVEQLATLRSSISSSSRHVRSQQPLLCADDHLPEPDFFVLPGSLRDYSGYPRAADAWCVIEVADSSYERDIGEKLQGYARAGVRQYVVVNLRNDTAEVFTMPNAEQGNYADRVVIDRAGTLSLRVGEAERYDVPLASILPA